MTSNTARKRFALIFVENFKVQYYFCNVSPEELSQLRYKTAAVICSTVLEILTLQCGSRGTEHSSVSGPATFTGAIQKASQPPLGRWHWWQWQAAPVSAPFPLPIFAVSCFPGIFQQLSLSSHDPRDSRTPLPSALAHGCVPWPGFSDLAPSREALPDLSLQRTAPWGSKAYWDSLLLLSNFQSVPKQTGFLFKSLFLGTTFSKERDKQENNSKSKVQLNHYRTTHHMLLRSICLTAHCTSSVEVTHVRHQHLCAH